MSTASNKPSSNNGCIKPAKWQAIAGKWTFEESNPTYHGPSHETIPFGLAGIVPFGLALSDASLRDGIVRISACFETGVNGEPPEHGALRGVTGGVVLGYQSGSASYVVVSVGGFDKAFSIGEFEPGLGWRSIDGAGTISNIEAGRSYALRVTQAGQRIALAVDDVRVLDTLVSHPLPGNQIGAFAYGNTRVRFRDVAIETRHPLVFVAMPFEEPFNTLYKRVIEPIAEGELEFEAVRIDEKAGPGIIFEDIKNEIQRSKVVIAEITSPNENVYYELGYAHALNKPTILLAQRGRELPFDIRSYRVIFYDDTIGGKPEVEENLRKHLRLILRDL